MNVTETEPRPGARSELPDLITSPAPPRTGASCIPGLIALFLAITAAIGLHLAIAGNEPPFETTVYTQFLCGFLGLTALAGVAQRFWPALRRWMHHTCPIIAALFALL